MLKALTAALLLVLGAGSAGAWTHGIPAAAVTCDISTGVATGTGAGTCASPAATCDGVANDNAAFTSFNAWATGTWQASHSGLIELTLPANRTCLFSSGASGNAFTAGIRSLRIMGNGASLSDNNGTGNGFFLGGGPTAGVKLAIVGGNPTTALFQTSAVGATSIELVDSGLASLFNVGEYALITGIDLQGFGSPPNPAFWDYVQITAKNGGTLSFTPPLRTAYKSTWPAFNAGSAFEPNLGGPATIYSIGQNWNTDQSYYNLTIAWGSSLSAMQARGRNISFYNVAFTGPLCFWPTQNGSVRLTDVTMTPSCVVEVDKMVDTMHIYRSRMFKFDLQSAAVKVLTFENTTFTDRMRGTARDLTEATNSTFAELGVGAIAYGASGEVRLTNTSFTSIPTFGTGSAAVNKFGTWSNGVYSIPPRISVSSAASGPGGIIRLTVNSTTGWTDGVYVTIAGSGLTPCAGTFPVDVIDATTMDLIGSTYTATCSGSIGETAQAWAVPGANVYFATSNYLTMWPSAQIVDISKDATGTHVMTTLAGALPTTPIGGTGNVIMAVHPAPKFTCTNCTGSADALDLSNAGAQGQPIWSYSQRTRVQGACASQPIIPVFGSLVTLKVTVNTASNAGGAMNILPGGFVQIPNNGTAQSWAPVINARVQSATPRTITPTGNSGAQSGDTLTPPGSGAWLVDNQYSASCSSAPAGGDPIDVTVEYVTSQGVVYP